MVARLAEHPRIVAVKDAVREFRDHQRMVVALDSPSFRVLAGAGRLLLPSLAVGSSGGVFHEATVAPGYYRDLAAAMARSDLATARAIHARLQPLHAVLSRSDPAGAKTALALLGLCAPAMTAPLHEPSPALRAEIADVLRELELL